MDGGLPSFPEEERADSPLFTDEVQNEGSSRDEIQEEESHQGMYGSFNDLLDVTTQIRSDLDQEASVVNGMTREDMSSLLTDLDTIVDGFFCESTDVPHTTPASDGGVNTYDQILSRLKKPREVRTIYSVGNADLRHFLHNPVPDNTQCNSRTFLQKFSNRIIARYPNLLNTPVYQKIMTAMKSAAISNSSGPSQDVGSSTKRKRMSIFNKNNEIVMSSKGITAFTDGVSRKVYICNHGKLRHGCRICNPGAFCVHSKEKYKCKVCPCKHEVPKGECPECSQPQSGICAHGKRLYLCQPCGGKGFCEHGIWRPNCTACKNLRIQSIMQSDPSSSGVSELSVIPESTETSTIGIENAFCIHNKRKSLCKECNKCIHKKHKDWCSKCGTGKYICVHRANKYSCKECKAARGQAAT